MADINLPVVSDSAVISESLGYYSDQIDINEQIKLLNTSNISVLDTITLTENVQLVIESNVNKSDSVTISENIQTTNDSQINVSDTITATDVLSSDNPLVGGSDTSSSAPIIFLTTGQIAVRLSNKMYLPL